MMTTITYAEPASPYIDTFAEPARPAEAAAAPASVVAGEAMAPRERPVALTPAVARAWMMFCLVAATAVGFLVTGSEATTNAAALAGDDLTRLLRGMAALKALMAASVIAGVFWRLGAVVSAARCALYAALTGGMAAGLGLIWGLVYVRSGALLLHGGLLFGLVTLWRDPAVAHRLAAAVASRRALARTPRAQCDQQTAAESSLAVTKTNYIPGIRAAEFGPAELSIGSFTTPHRTDE